ncbi:MAG: toll/interleukin-1 receptor domain-containing protein [Alphaproteobacteria bacterium]|nr:toll/interleukin-1 receptor domain-containing protein [Alphaproteobacteria bacterium]
MSQTPMQIVVARDRSDRRTNVYVDTLRLAFEGSGDSARSPSAYLAEAVDLGIRVLEPGGNLEAVEARRLLEGARDTVFVVIGAWPKGSNELSRMAHNPNVVKVPSPSERGDGEIQGPRPEDGVEIALAPVVTALRAMERARRVLVSRMLEVGRVSGDAHGLQLFISHAKVDGIAMARSLVGVLQQLKAAGGEDVSFDYFYDAEHIEPGSVWRYVINEEASRSMLIALRTEAYEGRYWCRREFLAAERRGLPILVVDLRREQYHESSQLPFDVVPSVRVHDGNLIRVVLHAMALHLRALRVQSMTLPTVNVLPHRPSVYSLSGAIRVTVPDKIAYPGPKLPKTFLQAVAPMLGQGPNVVQLVTFDEL